MTETAKAYTSAETEEHLAEIDAVEAERFHEQMHNAAIADGLRSLVMVSGQNSADHGFHEGFPNAKYEDRKGFEYMTPAEQRVLQLNLAEKLVLIHEETSEALGEIRSGRDPLEIYFVDHKGKIGPVGQEYAEQMYETSEDGTPVPLLKPEGFLVEVADILIRAGDMTFLVHGREKLVEARRIKHEYNATRPYKHGRKF